MISFAFLVALGLCALHHVQGDCRMQWKGDFVSFSKEKTYVNLPCKYHATTVHCDGYRIHVAPGQAYDRKFRFYTKTVWIGIEKGKNFWHGKTGVKALKRYFQNNSSNPFITNEENLLGAPFDMEWDADESKATATIGVYDANFAITYFSYDPRKKDLRRSNGVQIVCSDPTPMNKTAYPLSLCGTHDSKRAISKQKRKLGLKSKSKSIIYDILDNEAIVQTNPQCEVATQVFKTCKTDKAAAIEACADAVMNNKLAKCLRSYGDNPMDLFVSCLKYQCTNDAESCNDMKETLMNCPKIPGLPDTCPQEVTTA